MIKGGAMYSMYWAVSRRFESFDVVATEGACARHTVVVGPHRMKGGDITPVVDTEIEFRSVKRR